MIRSFLLVTAVLGISFFLHIISYRLFSRHHISSLYSVFSYAVGFIALIVGASSGILVYPITCLTVYVSVAICLSWLSFAIFLGGETPSLMIFAAYENHTALTRQQLIHLFTREGVITKRVNDLYRANLVVHRKGILALTAKGKLLAAVINRYQIIFNRKERG